MQDRIPVEVLPNGAIRYAEYDNAGSFVQYRYLLLDDNATQTGTPINKNTLLKDTTATFLGLPITALPDDALKELKTLVDAGTKIEDGSYVGTGGVGTKIPLNFTPKIVVIVIKSNVNSKSTLLSIKFSQGIGFVANIDSDSNAFIRGYGITTNGFNVSITDYATSGITTNTVGQTYQYVAIG